MRQGNKKQTSPLKLACSKCIEINKSPIAHAQIRTLFYYSSKTELLYLSLEVQSLPSEYGTPAVNWTGKGRGRRVEYQKRQRRDRATQIPNRKENTNHRTWIQMISWVHEKSEAEESLAKREGEKRCGGGIKPGGGQKRRGEPCTRWESGEGSCPGSSLSVFLSPTINE